MLESALLVGALGAGMLAQASAQSLPATRVELIACRTRDERLECLADIHVDPDTELYRNDEAQISIGYVARRTNGMFRVLRSHVYPVTRHALRRSIPIPLEALAHEELHQPAKVKLALFRSATAEDAPPEGARMMVALSEQASLDDLPEPAGWSPNPEFYAGGDGSDCDEQAIVILAEDTRSGQQAEYAYIRGRYPGAEVVAQSYSSRGERKVDTFDLLLEDGSAAELCFDITAFFGEF